MLLTLDEAGISSSIQSDMVHVATEDEPDILFSNSFLSLTTETPVNSSSFFAVTSAAGTSYKPCFYPPDQSPFIFAIYDIVSETLLNLGQIKNLQGETVNADWEVPASSECGSETPVDVYKYKGSVQCEIDSGESFTEMQQNLIDEGIEVLAAEESNDGLFYTQVCGASDGLINVFSIRQSQLSEVQSLGFNVLQ